MPWITAAFELSTFVYRILSKIIYIFLEKLSYYIYIVTMSKVLPHWPTLVAGAVISVFLYADLKTDIADLKNDLKDDIKENRQLIRKNTDLIIQYIGANKKKNTSTAQRL